MMISNMSAHNLYYFVDDRYVAYADDPEVYVGFAGDYVVYTLKTDLNIVNCLSRSLVRSTIPYFF